MDGRSKVDQIRQLQEEFSKSGFESRLKIFILSQSEKMNTSAANSLLKFLEEPVGEFLSDFRNGKCWTDLADDPVPLSNHSFFTIGERKIANKAAKEGLSQESSRLLSYLTNSYHKAVEISQEEWFNETKDAVAQWVKYLLKKDPQAFIFVQKSCSL